jgi:hypothetical protein
VTADQPRPGRFELVDGPLPSRDDPAPSDRRVTGRRAAGPAALVVLATALLVAIAATVLPHREQDGTVPPSTPQSTPPSTAGSPSASGPSASCDLADPGCRIVAATRWRERTAAILRERLDPTDSYFTGYSYSINPVYDAGSRLNALGLEVYRLQGGGTEVFVQIAKTGKDAVRCGTITRQRCTGQRFMDGNRFSMTMTTTVAEGIEVQHIPTGTYVITLVARNTTGGRVLELGIGDLIAVAQDPRLRPPPS